MEKQAIITHKKTIKKFIFFKKNENKYKKNKNVVHSHNFKKKLIK